MRGTCSCACLSKRLTEETRRPEEQDHDQQHEGHDVAPLGAEQRGPPVLRDSEHQSAEQRTAEVADATQDGGGERLDAEEEADVEPGGTDLDHVEERRSTGHDAAEEERHL